MPSSLRLQRLCVCARNKLCLHFDSVEETGSHLRAFDITCRYLLHQEPIDALQVYILACDTCSTRSIPCRLGKEATGFACALTGRTMTASHRQAFDITCRYLLHQ